MYRPYHKLHTQKKGYESLCTNCVESKVVGSKSLTKSVEEANLNPNTVTTEQSNSLSLALKVAQ